MKAVSANSQQTTLGLQESSPDRLVRAAHQFEAILLNQLLGSLEHSFSTLGKEKQGSGSDRYHFLAVQQLASNMAARGGIGIADMIIRSLKQRGTSPTLYNPQKSLSGFSERLDVNF